MVELRSRRGGKQEDDVGDFWGISGGFLETFRVGVVPMMAYRRTAMAHSEPQRGQEIEKLRRHGIVYTKEAGGYVKLPEPITLEGGGNVPLHLTPEWQIAEQVFKDLDSEYTKAILMHAHAFIELSTAQIKEEALLYARKGELLRNAAKHRLEEHYCELCGFKFNEERRKQNLKPVNANKKIGDEKWGDSWCLQEQERLRGEKRRAKDKKQSAEARATATTNGHRQHG
jgi:hypothetical protein